MFLGQGELMQLSYPLNPLAISSHFYVINVPERTAVTVYMYELVH